MKRRLDAADHDTFAQKLLLVLSDATGNSDVADLACLKRSNRGHGSRILDARFSIGGDDGAYLRSNVMPLHSSINDSDGKLAHALAPELERAGQKGVLKAMAKEVEHLKDSKRLELNEHFKLLGWMLTLTEVYDFAYEQLSAEGKQDALALLQQFDPRASGASRQAALLALGTATSAEDIKKRCDLLATVSMVLQQPFVLVKEQLEKTLGAASGTGTEQLCDAVNRLALAARVTPAVRASDDLPVGALQLPNDSSGPVPLGASATPAGAAQLAAQGADTGVSSVVSKVLSVFAVAGALINGGTARPGDVIPPPKLPARKNFDEMKDDIFKFMQAKAGELPEEEQQAILKTNMLDIIGDGTYDHFLRVQGIEPGSVVTALEGVVSDLEREIADAKGQAAAAKGQAAAAKGTKADELARWAAELEGTIENYKKEGVAEQRLQNFIEEVFNRVLTEYKLPFLSKPMDIINANNWELMTDAFQRFLNYPDREALQIQLGNVVAKYRTAARLKANLGPFPNDLRVLGKEAEFGAKDLVVVNPVAPPPSRPQAPPSSVPESPAPPPPRGGGGAGDDGWDPLLLLPLVFTPLLVAQRAKDPDEGGGGADGGMCGKPPEIKSARDVRNAIDGVCAATSQLREDGGVRAGLRDTVQRTSGVSPFWLDPHVVEMERSPMFADFWRRTLWPRGREYDPLSTDGSMQDLRERLNNFDKADCRLASDYLTTYGSSEHRSLAYAVVRGLCGYRGPHHAVPDGENCLKYSLPLVNCPYRPLDATVDYFKTIGVTDPQSLHKKPTLEELAKGERAFCHATIPTRSDFVVSDGELEPAAEYTEEPKLAAWAPVRLDVAPAEVAYVDDVAAVDDDDLEEKLVPVLDTELPSQAVADAAVLEHLLDYYRRIAFKAGDDNKPLKLLALGCAACAKLMQLKSMAFVAQAQIDSRGTALCNSFVADSNGDMHFLVTRPVLRCPGPVFDVLYPCDAGLCGWSFNRTRENDGIGDRADGDPKLGTTKAKGRANPGGDERVDVERSLATKFMRAAIGRQRSGASSSYGPSGDPPPLYVARPPSGASDLGPVADATKRLASRQIPRDLYAKDPKSLDIHIIGSTMTTAANLCKQLEQLQCEAEYIEKKSKELDNNPGDDLDAIARERREAVWDDATREAAVSGDRLYAFVRQLSGTISENVDSVCQIDEGMLVRQQQQLRERRARAADQAAREHMTLVRNVFASVLRESGLTLGIGETGDAGQVGQLKVVSGNLRKQATQLTQQGSSSEGFFANAVRLEQLLTKGTGELTIKELFDRLREAGHALQEAALSAHEDGVPGAMTTLDFLSAPRNSLVLRYKPESLAALRQAFDVFQREMAHHYGRMHRHISAYELIEGRDETLCTAFAAFAAHMLVHSRMYSSATAMYVAAWPAAANAQQLKISLQRLVSVACNYLTHVRAPGFGVATGRDHYFAQAAAPAGGAPLALPAPRRAHEPRRPGPEHAQRAVCALHELNQRAHLAVRELGEVDELVKDQHGGNATWHRHVAPPRGTKIATFLQQKQLFGRLQEAGAVLREAAAGSSATDATGSSMSLDFLSAPRNSLMLRYKPETLAAMRQAFDIFQREMAAQHGRLYRQITVYELIEGNDDSLCGAFAQFSAHMLVHSRMHSSATAMYVSQWPAAANVQQLKISLQRLVRTACDYIAHTPSPAFLSECGRDNYFGPATAPYGGAQIPTIRYVPGPPARGAWWLN